VLLAGGGVDVADVGEALVVEPGQDRRAVHDDVVAGARRELGGHPGGQLEVRDVVDADFDPVLVAPLLGELVVEPGVRGRDEVAPLKDAQGRALDLGRRLAGIEHGQERASGHSGAGDREEFPAVEGEGAAVG